MAGIKDPKVVKKRTAPKKNRNMSTKKLTNAQCAKIRRNATRGSYLINPITGRKVYATSSSGKALVRTCAHVPKATPVSRKRMSYRLRTPKVKKFKSNRPSPGESATLFPAGTRRRGNDGNMWVIKITSAGVHRWVREHRSK